MQRCFFFPPSPEQQASRLLTSCLISAVMWCCTQETAVTTLLPLGHITQVPAGAQCQVTLGLGHTTTEYDRNLSHPYLITTMEASDPDTLFPKRKRPEHNSQPMKDRMNGSSLAKSVTFMLTPTHSYKKRAEEPQGLCLQCFSIIN